MTTLRPFFSYYGGKYRLAPRYPAPEHGCIVEPFAGSAGYALRYADRAVTLVDADPVICGVWSFLVRSSAADIERLPLIERSQTVDDLSVCQEARWLIGFWCNSATSAPRKRLSKWSLAHPDQFWSAGVRARVARQVDAIKHWRVVNASFDTLPNERATYFVDPPYVGVSRVSKYGQNTRSEARPVGDRYRFGTRAIDFASLGQWCRTRRGQVIACENVGATWLPFRPFHEAKATCGRNRDGVSREAVWTNEAPQQLTLDAPHAIDCDLDTDCSCSATEAA